MAFICVLQYIVWSRPSSAISVANIYTGGQTAWRSEMKAGLLSFYKNKHGPRPEETKREWEGAAKNKQTNKLGVAGEACEWKWIRPSTGHLLTQ